MRIAVFTDAFLPQINGVVTHVIETARELVKRGHFVYVYAPKPRKGVFVDSSAFPFRLTLLPSLPAFFYPDIRITVPLFPKIVLELRKLKIDIVHVHDPFTVATDGVLAAKILKIPLVMTFHTFFMDEKMLENIKVGFMASHLKDPLWRFLVYYHSLASAVICPSREAYRELKKRGFEKKMIIIPNGIDLSGFRESSQKEKMQKRRKYGLEMSDFVGIYVGRLAVDKSLDIVIEAWKKVSFKIPNAKLVIVGGGPEENKLKQKALDLKISNKVMFLGKLERNEIIREGILNIADIFVTASKIENQSYAVLEAMASGLPIVGVEIRGLPELVDAKNGILVKPDSVEELAEAVISLFSNKAKMKKLSKGAIRKVKKYSLVNTTDKQEKLYLSLIGKR